MNSYTSAVNITADLTSGDVSIPTERKTNQNYNIIPGGIMVTKDTTTATVETVVCRLVGGMESVTLYLKINEIYDIAVEEVFKSGTSTEAIILFGYIN